MVLPSIFAHPKGDVKPPKKTPLFEAVEVDTYAGKVHYGHQEGAKLGCNPQKAGRPSHTYHTYMMANLHLVLEVEVQAGNQAHSNHSLPGLIALLNRLPTD